MGPGLVTRARSRVSSDSWQSDLKKASLNSVATAMNQGARAIVGFVVNPLLVRYLGPVTFGNWQVVHRLIGQTNPAGGRPSEALKWFIAHRQSSDDLHVKRQAVGSAIVVWLIFIPVLLPIGAVVGWFAPNWLHVPASDYAVVRLTAADPGRGCPRHGSHEHPVGLARRREPRLQAHGYHRCLRVLRWWVPRPRGGHLTPDSFGLAARDRCGYMSGAVCSTSGWRTATSPGSASRNRMCLRCAGSSD